ncbi:MAG: molecular chaperone [Gemmobacter sp.]
MTVHLSDSEIDALRGHQYALLSSILAAAPDPVRLAAIAAMSGDATALGQAYAVLARAAAGTDSAAVEREFFELFVGVGRGELLPYASFYLTGFLNERPLADLRADLARLGLERAAGRHEPEDHVAFVFEVMAQLVSGAVPSAAVDEATFFRRHIQPWAGQFFDDLAVAPSARFYRPVAEIGRLWVDIEARAFALAESSA